MNTVRWSAARSFTLKRVLRGLAYRLRVAPRQAASVGVATLLRFRNRFSTSSVVGDEPVLVSMTTYGARFHTVHLALESIGRGSVRPSRMVLWVDDPELADNPTPQLLRLIRRGLEVLPCEDYGPHKKYYPALSIMEKELRLDRLITTDDDILYRRNWLSGLVSSAARNPDVILCYRARVVQLDERGFRPWSEWPLCATTSASLLHLAIGDAGVSYPRSMLGILARRGTGFMSVAPRADDIWLHATAVEAGIRTRQLRRRSYIPLMTPGSQAVALAKENIGGGANDRQIGATYQATQIEMLRRAKELDEDG